MRNLLLTFLVFLGISMVEASDGMPPSIMAGPVADAPIQPATLGSDAGVVADAGATAVAGAPSINSNGDVPPPSDDGSGVMTGEMPPPDGN